MIERIALIGAGTMGGGIAISALAAGLPVQLIDLSNEALARADARIRRHFERQVAKGRLDAGTAGGLMAGLTLSTDLAEAGTADLVIEAVFEDLGLKRDLLSRLAPHLSRHSVVATNTSALRVRDLSMSSGYPEQFLGLHFFSPAEINPLVEIVRGPDTSAQAMTLAEAFVARIGKTPLACLDQSGFAVNRFFCPFYNEAVRLLDEGHATPAQIDRVACETFGLALGPFAVLGIIGARVALRAVEALFELGPSYEPARGLIEAGRRGETWVPAAEDPALPHAEGQQVARRLQAALFLPVLQALGEEVAAPEAMDRGAALALRFGRPPVAMMRSLGRVEVARLVADYAAFHDTMLPLDGFSRVFDAARPAPVLQEARR